MPVPYRASFFLRGTDARLFGGLASRFYVRHSPHRPMTASSAAYGISMTWNGRRSRELADEVPRPKCGV